jgi:hypothetical protein
MVSPLLLTTEPHAGLCSVQPALHGGSEDLHPGSPVNLVFTVYKPVFNITNAFGRLKVK